VSWTATPIHPQSKPPHLGRRSVEVADGKDYDFRLASQGFFGILDSGASTELSRDPSRGAATH